MGIFDYRITHSPREFEYCDEFADAIDKAFWTEDEYHTQVMQDVNDMRVLLSPHENLVAERAMLTISQVEVSVKRFWRNIDNWLQKPEFSDIGAAFSNNERIHSQAYAIVLKAMGLEKDFDMIMSVPVVKERVETLEKYLNNSASASNEEFVEQLILFSVLVENISLFGQFLTLRSYNWHRRTMVGIKGLISSTQIEEDLHAKFGMQTVNYIRQEYPEWFTEEKEAKLVSAIREMFNKELALIDWIFNDHDLDFLSREEVKNFLRNRLNNSLKTIGFKPIFEIDSSLLTATNWFDKTATATSLGDFFATRLSEYSRGGDLTPKRDFKSKFFAPKNGEQYVK